MDSRKIDTVPGKTHAYSNFGYSVLGRIIEKASGQSYKSYVRKAILNPAGVKDMHIAGDTKGEKRRNEVVYHHSNAYKMPVARMDAHGGWIASPIDLMRFMVRVDGLKSKPDLLKDSTIKTMTQSKLPNDYAKGWTVKANNWTHGGFLNGSRSLLSRRSNGYSWTILVNSSDGNGSLKETMKKVVDGVKKWPSHDLF